MIVVHVLYTLHLGPYSCLGYMIITSKHIDLLCVTWTIILWRKEILPCVGTFMHASIIQTIGDSRLQVLYFQFTPHLVSIFLNYITSPSTFYPTCTSICVHHFLYFLPTHAFPCDFEVEIILSFICIFVYLCL